MDNKFNLGRVIGNIGQLKRSLPIKLANQAQNFFFTSFKQQGWEDNTLRPWAVPKRRIPGTPEYKYPKNKGLSRRTTPTLVRSGLLRRSVSESIRNTSFDSIKLTVALPYADVHNTGTDKIPKRQFFGHSKTLETKQVELITNEIDRVWQV